ncbi:uncharacterized protein LOC128197904 [Vigna angularis]|uniref:uncharacterized protein LOC128197904 n=1 Tax=Phaseolus angularis TaxID=3914 RepID=UPI0022B46E55|nr:uncharacterized protein LOC128197904 [Vigna angularis]
MVLLPTHARVMINDPRDPQARVPLPTSEIQFVGEALGTFIAWPKAMIMPYFGPPTVYRPEKQPSAQPVNETREEAEDHDVISILTSKLNKLRKGPIIGGEKNAQHFIAYNYGACTWTPSQLNQVERQFMAFLNLRPFNHLETHYISENHIFKHG